MHSSLRRVMTSGAVALLLVSTGSGCSSLNKTEKGAIIGAAAGGAAGGLISSSTKGAIIGAVIGGAAGAIIGHQMDKQAQELKEIPGARVERVGEGIQVTFDSGLLFDFDSDVIKGNARANLDQLAASLQKYQDSNLLIAGHTDNVGTESYNMDLSRRRADAAAAYLRSQGVSRTIRTMGRGEMEPVASNETDSGRSENRRVELAIYANEEMVEKAKAQAGG